VSANTSKIMAGLFLALIMGVSSSAVGLQVPAAEAGNCSYSPSFASNCLGWATMTCNRSDTMNPAQDNNTTEKIDYDIIDNCDPNAAPRPGGPGPGASDAYQRTFNVNIAPGISGGDDVKGQLTVTLGWSSATTITCSTACPGPDVPACKTMYLELRAYVDEPRSVTMSHLYSCTLVFQNNIPHLQRSGGSCFELSGETVNSTGCTGNASSSASGNNSTGFYCPTPVVTQCTNQCCQDPKGSG